MTDRWTNDAALASVRQDLLAPANAIAGYADLLLEDAGGHLPPDLADDLERIRAASRSLLSLADELLSPHRIEALADHADRSSVETQVRHDLRNPLSAIRGYGEMVLEELDDEGEQLEELAEDLRHLLRATDTLLEQLDAIVDFSGANDANREDDLDLHAMAAELAASLRPGDPQTRRRVDPGCILLVEDNDSNRALLARRLEKAGHDVLQACDGRTALNLMETDAARIDVVLLDLMMPGINGFEILTRIKRHPGLRHVPVIMISALREMESIVRCLEYGADDYLPKPVNNTLLFARLDASLARKQAQDRERRYLERIEEEKRKSESLLRNILPEPIVERLHRGETVTGDPFDEVTVVFADIVGFTRMSARIAPRDMVVRLNRLFSAFDRLTQEQGVEKIKTIGDAYLAAAGLPEPAADHADRAARLALGMQRAVRELNRELDEPFRIRVGLHSGPLAAGILGTHKFVYDIWGDTVNIASRLESSAEPGSVQLSAATAKRLGPGFGIDSLGLRALKGKGEVPVYRLRDTA